MRGSRAAQLLYLPPHGASRMRWAVSLVGLLALACRVLGAYIRSGTTARAPFTASRRAGFAAGRRRAALDRSREAGWSMRRLSKSSSSHSLGWATDPTAESAGAFSRTLRHWLSG
jgi:hypothetical protein